MMHLSYVLAVYNGTNGDATKELYGRLEKIGPNGCVAMNLFRACKTSDAAKRYKGRYVQAAYDRKQWSMGNLCTILQKNGSGLAIDWGWNIDKQQLDRGSPHHHVLYVEIPTGQVSFHNGSRGDGPEYPKPWDGIRGASVDRICRWTASVLENHYGRELRN